MEITLQQVNNIAIGIKGSIDGRTVGMFRRDITFSQKALFLSLFRAIEPHLKTISELASQGKSNDELFSVLQSTTIDVNIIPIKLSEIKDIQAGVEFELLEHFIDFEN